jgi:hypothetical protein
MTDKPPQPPSGKRLQWLPFVGTSLGVLFGLAAGGALFWLRARNVAYEGYGDFGGLGQAICELWLLPLLGAFLGGKVGFHLSRIVQDSMRS